MDGEPDEITRIRTILSENPKGLTIEEIAKKFPLNRTSTAKYLNTLLISGQAEMRTFGRAKVFTLSQRIPFSQMLNLSSDLLIVLNHDLYIDQVNEPLLKTFNLQNDDLEGIKIENSSLFPYLENNLEIIRDSAKGKEITKQERIEIQGKEFFFRMKMIPVVFDQGEQGLAVILTDITELKQYQQHLEHLVEERTQKLRETNDHLEQSEKKYRELVENANSIILRVNDKGTISFFNEFAERFFGVSESAMLGKNIIGTILPLPVPAGKLPEDTAREFLVPTEYLADNEVPCTDKNGEQAWVAWTIRPVMNSHQISVEYLLVGMDITERKNVENALQRINAKLNLVSSIARHDILNKLTVISGNLFLLKEMITDKVQIGHIQQAEDAMTAIANQIHFTRDFKDMGMEKAYWHHVRDLLLQIREELNQGNQILDVPENDVEIFADPWLKKVFINLIEFTRHKEQSAKRITIRYQELSDGLEIILENNGTGISADKKEKLFERGCGESNGCGLFLAHEILAITGITISEVGKPGDGIRFAIHIPKRGYRIISGKQ